MDKTEAGEQDPDAGASDARLAREVDAERAEEQRVDDRPEHDVEPALRRAPQHVGAAPRGGGDAEASGRTHRGRVSVGWEARWRNTPSRSSRPKRAATADGAP